MLRAFNVLEGTTRGQILVDDRARPKWAIARDRIYGTLYLGGEFTPALLATLVDHFRTEGSVGIGCWHDDPINRMLPPDPDYDGTTLYFTNRSADVTLAALWSELPGTCALARRDERLFAQSFDYAPTLAAFGSVEDALRLTLGVVVLHDGSVACEAATGAATHGQIEIGVTTAEPYRRRGYATIACAKLIELCELQGYTTWWDSAKQNSASARLARKLGYRSEREYRYAWWAQRAV
jgi:RimJ/RimL family protein N-acetyltransferase